MAAATYRVVRVRPFGEIAQPTIAGMHDSPPRRRPFGDLRLDDFTQVLASAEPVPGGGSASAVAAALGASLVAMVARLSTGRPKYAAHEDLLTWAIDDRRAPAHPLPGARRRGRRLVRGVRRGDEAAPRRPRPRSPRARQAMSDAARVAAEVPLACVELCVTLVGAAEALAGRSNANASSDLNVAALLGEAAANGAAANVLVNLPSIDDPASTAAS